MVQTRKQLLASGCYYHIFSRSIAKYEIFNSQEDYCRFLELIELYRYTDFRHKYSKFIDLDPLTQVGIKVDLQVSSDLLVGVVAYCIMPTHFHLILKQNLDQGISRFMGKVLNSYARYFNTKYHRVGPLWTGRFKSVLVFNDEQLLHLTRYLHLNPTSAGLVKKPQDWQHSSYTEYLSITPNSSGICSYSDVLDFDPANYKKFVNDRQEYQRNLSLIKYLMFDDYAG